MLKPIFICTAFNKKFVPFGVENEIHRVSYFTELDSVFKFVNKYSKKYIINISTTTTIVGGVGDFKNE